ncbi:MAG: hypothetical protein DBX40_04690, partial [Clostridiales bacterium]
MATVTSNKTERRGNGVYAVAKYSAEIPYSQGRIISTPYVELEERVPTEQEGEEILNSVWEEYLNIPFDTDFDAMKSE